MRLHPYLLGDEQEVVLLAALGQDVLVVEQERGVDGHVLVGHLLLVHAHTAALGHLAHLALAGEHGCVVGEQVDEGHAGSNHFAGHLKGGHAVEYREQGVLVDLVQNVLRLVAEEYLRSLNGHFVVLLAVHHAGDFLGEALLQRTQAGILLLLCHEVGNLVLGQVGEYLDVACSVLVAHIEPELIELVGRGALGIEPHITTLGLAELGAVGLGDERAGDGECLATLDAANQFGRCHPSADGSSPSGRGRGSRSPAAAGKRTR